MAKSDYQVMRDAGRGAIDVFRIMQGDGLGAIEAIRSIRELFGLSLVEAKEVMLQAEGWEGSLGDYQRDVLLPIMEGYLGGDEKK